jgi:hypothetical protein
MPSEDRLDLLQIGKQDKAAVRTRPKRMTYLKKNETRI